jgi:hypothetical protein
LKSETSSSISNESPATNKKKAPVLTKIEEALDGAQAAVHPDPCNIGLSQAAIGFRNFQAFERREIPLPAMSVKIFAPAVR